MKKALLLTPLFGLFALASCGGNSATTITVCASELPHALILKEIIKPVVKDLGFDLNVTVLDWTLQNGEVAAGSYDANYFQHTPYLDNYNGDEQKVVSICKVHYEKLCLYAADTSHMEVTDGDSIIVTNDPTNLERALNLLVSAEILTINSSCYTDGKFDASKFSTTHPNDSVTFADDLATCKLACLDENVLATNLISGGHQFGVLPGNTAITGLGSDYAKRISVAEEATEETIDRLANIVAVKKGNETSDKSKALIKAFADARVKEFIEKTFGESVIYHYKATV